MTGEASESAEPPPGAARIWPMIQEIAHLGLLDDVDVVLDSAALELSALDHPGVDLAPYAELLGDMAERLGERGLNARTARERADALSEVIAGEFRFHGDRASYDDPANADLIQVIDRRLGLPVSLSILYVAAARRAGWEADALNTPGHVLVRIGPDTSPALIDPFAGGSLVDPGQLARLLAYALGHGAVPTSDHLAPMSNRSVLVRLLMNQATRAEAGGDTSRALQLFRRMTTIAPSSGQSWWERARLELIEGEVSEARASLSAMLEMTRDPNIRTHISAALDALAGSGG
ncbi:MAG: transglutaminase-like domain-containing protein [Pseudomonadota bacterium]|nr:transglutaminase-like domain-containing protein [Pseudomonadota bacterium]